MDLKNCSSEELDDIYEGHDEEKNYYERIPDMCQAENCEEQAYARINETEEYLCKRHGAEVVKESAEDDAAIDRASVF